ncbi:MAG: transcription repressor NadR [Enterococcus sp.]
MIDGEERRKQIIKELKISDKAISASSFAKQFGVSRQSIVGDIALMRAAGEEITATARGYLLPQDHKQNKLTRKLAVQHRADQTEEELAIIVSCGGEVLDVIVEHPLYGELTGSLHIKTKKDIELFMKQYQKSQATLLSQLTEGIHLHTIRYPDEKTLLKIQEELTKANILYLPR